jgi:metal-responsive CopG/Arc/MetJ family transcriptional regulator
MVKSSKYIQVNLPKEMASAIDKIVEKKELGFVSRDDFVRDAVRESIVKYGGA